MKKMVLAIMLVLATMAVPLTACSFVGGGPVTTRIYDIADFNEVMVGSAFNVDIERGDTFSISVTANKNLFDHIDVSKSGDTLRIQTKAMHIAFNPTLEAKVTMPELNMLEVSGASRVSASGFKSSDDFRLGVSGASKVDIDIETGAFDARVSGASRADGDVRSGDTRIEVSGASRVTFLGAGTNLTLTASGASQAALADFATTGGNVNISGASRGSVVVNGNLDIVLSGASTLEYSGNPTLGKTSVTGASNLRRIG